MTRAIPLTFSHRNEIPLGDGRQVQLGPELGRGSAATVYRGTYSGSFGVRRAVAVKVFDVIASDELEPVLSELATAARRVACVRHPNVVRLEEFGLFAPAQPYAILELVEGRTLASLLASTEGRRERMPLDLALFIGAEVAEALAGAWLACSADGVRLGLTHGDLSPCDVILSHLGEVKVGDFGFAAAARAASSIRSVRALTKRVRCLAPEVASGRPGDSRSDVFSLGVLLHELFVGPRFPPSVVGEQQALCWARDGRVHKGIFDPQLPPALAAIVTRALEREPERRYPHAGALVYELRRVALAMGVADGRSFLRTALARVFGDDSPVDPDEVTSELRMPRPSCIVRSPGGPAVSEDRFARLRAAPSLPDDDDEGGPPPSGSDGEP